MRKPIVILVGCIMLCGLLVAAMVPAPESAPVNNVITITGQPLEGVDQPFFVLSRGNSDTVRWHNGTSNKCTLTFSGGPPFPRRVIIPAGGDSAVFSAADAPGPPAGWPTDRVYKVYRYSVDIEGGALFDESPGGGVKP